MRHGLALLPLALSGVSGKGTWSKCSDVTFEVPVASENLAFASPPDPNNTTAIVDFIRSVWSGIPPEASGTVLINDTFTIKGTYCVPISCSSPKTKPKTTPNTLQILLHGITYNKSIWSGLGFPDDRYNWHAQANARGYATLALDRPGHGANPQRPDPLSVIQPQLQLDIIHAIATAVRSPPATSPDSPLNSLGQTYSKIILVGHSYGSFLAAALAAQHPTAADALVLTGYNSAYLDFSGMIAADWDSASNLDPDRFGAELDKGYLAMADLSQRTTAFYAGGYDPAFPAVDFAGADTLTAGEIMGLGAIIGQPAVGFRGGVFVATGVQDVIFCEEPREKCEASLEAGLGGSFPDAGRLGWFAPEETGHDLMLHYSVGETVRRVHDWLDGGL